MYKPEIITNAEYHGRKTHLSSTNIRTFKKNKKQFEYSLTHDLVKQTKAMADGTAVHAFFLERDKFDTDFVIKPADMRLNTKVGKEWAQEHQSKILLTAWLCCRMQNPLFHHKGPCTSKALCKFAHQRREPMWRICGDSLRTL